MEIIETTEKKLLDVPVKKYKAFDGTSLTTKPIAKHTSGCCSLSRSPTPANSPPWTMCAHLTGETTSKTTHTYGTLWTPLRP